MFGAAVSFYRASSGECSQVFESNSAFSVEGSVVLMNLNGQAAIEAIDPVLLQR